MKKIIFLIVVLAIAGYMYKYQPDKTTEIISKIKQFKLSDLKLIPSSPSQTSAQNTVEGQNPQDSVADTKQAEEKIREKRIKDKIASMTLDQKIGQLMIIGFEHTYADDHIKNMIENYGVGGVNLLARNIKDEEQMIKLSADLQTLASTSSGIPFMIAADQEGGTVLRFKFLEHKSKQLTLDSTDKAYEEAYKRGEELKRIGVTLNFAPVADYVTDKKSYLYDRTFGTTSDAIAPLAQSMLKGYEDAGIKGSIKHFPGYGNITNDPHKSTAEVDPETNIYLESLVPFRKILLNNDQTAVMTAHIIIPEIDTKPATLSKKFLKDMLRAQWNFDGVIITDDLEMASAGKIPVEELAVESIKAGNDMIISTYTSNSHPKIHAAIKKAVEDGDISIASINNSVERVLRLKGF